MCCCLERSCVYLPNTFAKQRIFSYGGPYEYTLQAIAVLAAIASGAGIALQNLIFGAFVTVITDYASGDSTKEVFLDDVAELSYDPYYYSLGHHHPQAPDH